MRLREAVLVAVVLFGLVPRVSAFDVSVETVPLCERLPGFRLGPPIPEVRGDPIGWIRGDAERGEDLNRIGALIRGSYPRYLGLDYDIEGQRVVMGVDPDASVEEAAAEIAGVMTSDLDVVVQPGCYSRASQAGIRKEIDAKLGGESRVLGGIMIGVDGRLEVFLLPQLPRDEVEEIALDLHRTYGDRVIVPGFEEFALSGSDPGSSPATTVSPGVPVSTPPVADSVEGAQAGTQQPGAAIGVPETIAAGAADDVPDAAGVGVWLYGSVVLIGAVFAAFVRKGSPRR